MKESIEFYVQFIAEVENNPELYNYRLTDYNNKRITENIWTKIGEKFDERGDACKSKWKSIRSAYIRSLNTKSKSGSAAGTKKEYYLAPYLLFLNSFTKSRPKESNTPILPVTQEDERDTVDSEYEIKIENTSNNESDLSSAEEDSLSQALPASSVPSPHSSSLPIKTPQSSTSRKHNISEADKCVIDYYTFKRKRLENQQKTETQHRDPCEMFLLSLVPHVTSMSQQQQLSFKRGVLGLIENIKYRHVTK